MQTAKIMFVIIVSVALCTAGGSGADVQDNTGSIAGKVINIKDKKPLAYVNVIVVGTTLGRMTQADGRFEIKNVPAGTYSVKAMMMGFKAVEKKDVIYKNLVFELAVVYSHFCPIFTC